MKTEELTWKSGYNAYAATFWLSFFINSVIKFIRISYLTDGFFPIKLIKIYYTRRSGKWDRLSVKELHLMTYS